VRESGNTPSSGCFYKLGGVDTENSAASLSLKDPDGGDFALRKLL